MVEGNMHLDSVNDASLKKKITSVLPLSFHVLVRDLPSYSEAD